MTITEALDKVGVPNKVMEICAAILATVELVNRASGKESVEIHADVVTDGVVKIVVHTAPRKLNVYCTRTGTISIALDDDTVGFN